MRGEAMHGCPMCLTAVDTESCAKFSLSAASVRARRKKIPASWRGFLIGYRQAMRLQHDAAEEEAQRHGNRDGGGAGDKEGVVEHSFADAG